MEELVIIAEACGCKIVAYSIHELDIVKQFCTDKDLVNKVEEMMAALAPGCQSPPPPKCGAAESCRRLPGGASPNEQS